MAWWEEVWSFVRGTRPRAPPRRSEPLVALLLVLAVVLHLPLLYVLVATEGLAPPFSLGIGLLAMALAWSAGTSLEGRRRGTALAFSAVGTAEFLLGFLPGGLEEPLGPWRYLLVVTSALCAGAWALLRRVE